MLARGLCYVAFGSLLGALAGCAGSQKVEGVVLLDGVPVEGATVTFIPEGDQAGRGSSAITDSQGVFKFGPKESLRSGTYKVLVLKVEKVAMSGDAAKDPTVAMSEMHKTGKMNMGNDPSGPSGAIPLGPMMKAPMAGATSASSLPARYSVPQQTPLTVTLPTNGKIELKLSKT